MASIDVTCVTSVNWVTYVSTTATAISVHRPAVMAPRYMAASASAVYTEAASASTSAANQGYEIATMRCGGFKAA